MIFANDNWPPQLRAAVVRSILADAPETDDELFANDNNPQITGAKAHSWPAMRLNAGEGCEQKRFVLLRLARLFELAAMPDGDVPSVAGMYKLEAASEIASLLDEVTANDDGSPGDPGYGVDFCMREGTDLVALVRAGAFKSSSTVLPNGKKGGGAEFQIIHVWENQLIDGKLVPIKFTSYAEYRLKCEWHRVQGERRRVKGKWRRVRGERFYAPRGPDRDDDEHDLSATAVHPSGDVGATCHVSALEERLGAKHQLERLRRVIGEDAFEVLRLAVVNRRTARQIGEAMGKKYNAASALGTKLIADALDAANDNWPMALTPKMAS